MMIIIIMTTTITIIIIITTIKSNTIIRLPTNQHVTVPGEITDEQK